MASTLLAPQEFNGHSAEPRQHTDGDVLLVAFGKEGCLYSVEEPGFLRQWNPHTGQRLGWHDLSDTETVWAFSADARVLASASDDLSVWDTSSGTLLTAMRQPSWVTALAFTPDSTLVVTGHDDGMIGYWDAAGHHPIFEKGLRFHKNSISALAVSPNGNMLAAASEDTTISIWDLRTGRYVACLSEHTDRIPALVWHPSGKFIVSVGWDATARVWDASTFEQVGVFPHATQITAMALSGDGRWLASADLARTIHVWDFQKKSVVHKFDISNADRPKPIVAHERRRQPRPEEPSFQNEICTLAFSPDGKYLACNGDRTIHLCNPQIGQAYAYGGSRPLARTTVSVHRDGGRLLSNAGGYKACILDTTTRQLITTLSSENPVKAAAYSPDGNWIAASSGTQIRVWDAAGTVFADWDGPGEPVTTIAFSPDSTLLAAGSVHGIAVWIWRVADRDGEPCLKIPDALDGCSIMSLAFHPENKHLAVGGIDWMATNPSGNNGQVSIWNLDERAEVATFLDGTTALAMHPSGDLLASTTLEKGIFVWDLRTKEFVNVLTGHDGPVTCLAYSPDGRWLASGSDDHTLRLWDAQGHDELTVEIESQLTSLMFSSDQQFVYMGHANTTCSRIQLPKRFRKK
jgi:WD40 repeat protein